VTKRRDYAEAGVREYWVVDRERGEVLVLRLDRGQYVDYGRFGRGEHASSHQLPGFAVSVDDIMSQGR
jgi:Uma2 family endonuclease